MAALILLILFSALSPAFGAQSYADTTNMSCVERLEIPTYPRIADLARLSATVTTTIRIASGGTRHTITTAITGRTGKVEQEFARSVENAVSASAFRNGCGGQTVTIVFQFALGEQVGSERVSFGYPNRFTIFAPSKAIQGSIYRRE